MAVRQYSEDHRGARRKELRHFSEYAAERNVTRIHDVSRAFVERYQRHLFYYRKKNGKPLGPTTQYQRICSVKMFLKWAARQHIIDVNPAADIDMPRLPMKLPREVLTPREAELVLIQPDVKELLGVRDRAMLEVLYSTGMRRKELANLLIHDVNQERGTVMVREGKGKRDRVVPIGNRALEWIEKYITETRGHLVVEPDSKFLFLSTTGEAFHPDYLTRMVRQYILQADVGKKGSCHIFRHTMATAMLENGADIRFIQAILGHAKPETTSIYTRVSITKLKEIHTATHPAGRPIEEKPVQPGEGTAAELLEDLAEEAISDEG